VITENNALHATVAEVFSTQTQSVISNCEITNNVALTKDEVNSIILTKGKSQVVNFVGYIHQSYKDHISENPYLLEQKGEDS
jgi:inosine-uridine nucleoside N-ribohydrolase